MEVSDLSSWTKISKMLRLVKISTVLVTLCKRRISSKEKEVKMQFSYHNNCPAPDVFERGKSFEWVARFFNWLKGLILRCCYRGSPLFSSFVCFVPNLFWLYLSFFLNERLLFLEGERDQKNLFSTKNKTIFFSSNSDVQKEMFQPSLD